MVRYTYAIYINTAPTDPSAYLVINYDVTKALPYIQKLNKIQAEQKITMTHLVSKGLAIAASKMRRDIGRIKWGYVRLGFAHNCLIVPTSGKDRSYYPG